MIQLSVFLVLLVFILAFFLFFKLLKGVIKAIIAVLFMALFVVAILGVIIYFDAMKIKKSFGEEQTILLSHDGSIVAGFSYANSDSEILQSGNLELISKEKLTGINSDIAEDTYDAEGMTIVIDSTYFKDSTVELSEDISIIITEKMIGEIYTCAKLDSCIDIVVDAAPAVQKQIESSFEDEQDLKNKLFFNLFAQQAQETKGTFIIKGLRTEDVSIYPQLTTIKLVKMVPDRVVDFALKKTIEKTADTIKSEVNFE